MANSQRMSLVDLRSLIENHNQIKIGNDLEHSKLSNSIVGNRDLSQITTQDTTTALFINDNDKKDESINPNTRLNDFNYLPLVNFPKFTKDSLNDKKESYGIELPKVSKKDKKKIISKEGDVDKRNVKLKDKCVENQSSDIAESENRELKELDNLELNMRIKGCLGILKTEILTSILKNEFNEEDVNIIEDSNINERKIIIDKILSHLIG
ncbi:uncharacterized protein TA06170 [Theileria annulata]|uniref:Uncharacterized protein n=1 Tax=Theileria annulata TaxID=5874 RepID=Q4UI70_THEAN|nr:uncharacterized protein TA06170 [Theileria annulata]CAI73219.1 hypothetical protein TA06170 [Theileria annulata]|eukprot:XP_953896.1 hypothetical protein TA06170 [Theileria annulata]